MYKYYNANPLGKIQSDCFLRALSCATNKSWDYVYENISDIAQSQDRMLNEQTNIFLKKIVEQNEEISRKLDERN